MDSSNLGHEHLISAVQEKYIRKSYYQITSPNEFIEWQRVGTKNIQHVVVATILPEKLLIADLLACADHHYIAIDEAEFTQAIS